MKNQIVLRNDRSDGKLLDYSVRREGKVWVAYGTSVDPWGIEARGEPGDPLDQVVANLADAFVKFFNRIEDEERMRIVRETVTEVRDGIRWRERRMVGVKRERVRWEVEAVILACEMEGTLPLERFSSFPKPAP